MYTVHIDAIISFQCKYRFNINEKHINTIMKLKLKEQSSSDQHFNECEVSTMIYSVKINNVSFLFEILSFEYLWM